MRKIKTLGLVTGLVLAVAAGGASAARGYNSGYDNGYSNDGYSSNGYSSNGYSSNGYGRAVRCESRDSRTTYCSVDTSGGVTLVRQNSRSDCIRGRTWGADGRGIWVARGCRATFAINDRNQERYGSSSGYDNNYNNGYNNNYSNGYNNGYNSNSGYGGNPAYSSRTVRCESNDRRMRYCGIDTRYGVSLVNQRSSSPCIEGSSWGVSARGVWVNGGCRADFATGSSRTGYNQGYNDRRY